MKNYKKLIANPLGLAVTIIKTDTFTSEDITAKDAKKLALAIKAKMVVEVDLEAEAQKVEAVKKEAAVTLDTVTKERDAAIASKAKLVDFAVSVMDVEELADHFLKAELLVIGKKLGAEVTAAMKEATIATKIIEAQKAE